MFGCSLNFLDRRLQAGMPSSRGEDWQPLLLYRNSLLHGETDQVPVTSKRAYTRRKKDQLAGKKLVLFSQKYPRYINVRHTTFEINSIRKEKISNLQISSNCLKVLKALIVWLLLFFFRSV